MYKKWCFFLSNIAFGGSLIVAAYALINIYLSRRGLPPGACPVDNYRSWLYLAIILGVISLLISFFGEKDSRQKPPDSQA